MEVQFGFNYTLSAIDKHFISTGERINQSASIKYDVSAFSATARQALLDLVPSLLDGGYRTVAIGSFEEIPTIEEVQLAVIESALKIAEKRKAEAEKLCADTIAQTLSIEQLEALSDDVLPESLEASGLRSWQCVKSLRDRLAAIEARSATIVKARETAAKEAAKAERLTWIENHGSDRLKRATSGGYNCQRLYVEERAALEYPEFDLDYADNLSIKDRSCPSVNALDELDRYPLGRIVWVKERHDRDSEEYYEDEYDGEEAIVIEDYLGNYTLVKYLGDPQD